MEMEEFIAWIRHIAWCGFQVAAGQNFNVKPTDEQWDSLLRGVDYTLNNPALTPEGSHDNWMLRRQEDGWILGDKIDPLAKTHPNLVPFGQLPETEKSKDLVGIMAHNLGLKLWGKVQADLLPLTKRDILEVAQMVKELGPSSGQERGMVTAPLPTEPRPRGKYLHCPDCKSSMLREPNFGFVCEGCGLGLTDSELATASPESYAKYFTEQRPNKAEPMPAVDPADTEPGPGCEPLKVKPLPEGVPGTMPVAEPRLRSYHSAQKMRKYRCAVFLQHRLSNVPENDQVLLSVQILHGKREHPTEPAVVVEVHALDEQQAKDTAMDLFRSLLTMKQVDETDGRIHR